MVRSVEVNDACAEIAHSQRACGNRVRVGLPGVSDDSAAICGRLKSDYRYSAGIVYSNFPWPVTATDKQRAAVEAAAQAVLDARAQYPASTLADLYDPLRMPGPLLKAHQALDWAVDRCYRKEPFASDRQRVEHLFELYEKLTAPLMPAAKLKRQRG